MFPQSFFPASYFPPNYWEKVGSTRLTGRGKGIGGWWWYYQQIIDEEERQAKQRLKNKLKSRIIDRVL